MGLFDSLTDVFTGKPQQDAAAQQRAYAAQQAAQVAAQTAAAREQGIGALQSGQAGALGAIGTGTAVGRGDIGDATQAALDAIRQSTITGYNAVYGGQNNALSALQSGVAGAVGAYDPLKAAASQYGGYQQSASDMTADALGLNGPEGIARAQQTFQATPGYQFQVGQGLDAITRANNALGGGNFNANALREAQTFGQGQASTEFQKYLDNLSGVSRLYAPLQEQALATAGQGTAQPYLTGGTAAANVYTGAGQSVADLAQRGGLSSAQTISGGGQSLADLAARGGLAEGGVYTGTGSGIANLVSGLNQQQTGYQQASLDDVLNTYQQEAAAKVGGSANLWGAIGGAAQLAAGGGFLPSIGPSGFGFGQAYGQYAPKKA